MSGRSTMMEVVESPDGAWEVRAIGTATGAGLGRFRTEAEANQWMLVETLRLESSGDLGTVVPGGGQGVR